MSTMTWAYEDINIALTLTFAAEHARLTHPQLMPIQVSHVAESGRSYVFERSSNEELLLWIEFEDLPEADLTTPYITSGYASLKSFLQNTINWKEKNFTLTDPDEDRFTVRYWEGFDSLEEAIGRSRRKGAWTGRIAVREII